MRKCIELSAMTTALPPFLPPSLPPFLPLCHSLIASPLGLESVSKISRRRGGANTYHKKAVNSSAIYGQAYPYLLQIYLYLQLYLYLQ